MLEHTHPEHDGAHPHTDQGEHLGHLPHLSLERGLPLGLAEKKPGDLAHLRVHTGGGHHHPAPAAGDHRAPDDHVLPLGQGGVLGQPAPAPLVHRQGLAGHGRLIRLEAGLPQHPSVGGDVVPGLQQDDVAGHQLTALQPPLQPLPNHPGLGGRELPQGLQGLAGVVLLGHGDHRVEENNEQNNGRVQPVLPAPGEEGQSGGGQQHQDHGIFQLPQHPPEHPRLFGLLQPVLPVLGQPLLPLLEAQALLLVGLQPAEHLVKGITVKCVVHWFRAPFRNGCPWFGCS